MGKITVYSRHLNDKILLILKDRHCSRFRRAAIRVKKQLEWNLHARNVIRRERVRFAAMCTA